VHTSITITITATTPTTEVVTTSIVVVVHVGTRALVAYVRTSITGFLVVT